MIYTWVLSDGSLIPAVETFADGVAVEQRERSGFLLNPGLVERTNRLSPLTATIVLRSRSMRNEIVDGNESVFIINTVSEIRRWRCPGHHAL